MPSRVRRLASAWLMIFSKAFERWLISRIEMPVPGRASRSRWASWRAGRGSTAGPGEKLYTRFSMIASWFDDVEGRRLSPSIANAARCVGRPQSAR